MTDNPFPGNPNTGQIAAADRRLARVREAVDRLVRIPAPSTGDRAADVIQFAHGPVVDAVLDLSANDGAMEPALIAMVAELLYRAAECEACHG